MIPTIKIIRGVTVSSLIIFGLGACSSSPSPWTEKDASPWSGKYATDADTASEVADEPVLLDEPVAEPVMIIEPEPEPEPIVVIEDLTPEQEVLAMPGSNYAVQVFAGKSIESVDNFMSIYSLYNLTMLKTDRSGSIIYILIDIHPDRSTANAAAVDLEASIGSKPWVRSLSGVQMIIAQ
jgi:septal ring-binding cell division protein DamX